MCIEACSITSYYRISYKGTKINSKLICVRQKLWKRGANKNYKNSIANHIPSPYERGRVGNLSPGTIKWIHPLKMADRSPRAPGYEKISWNDFEAKACSFFF